MTRKVAPGQFCQPGRGKKEAMTAPAAETTGTAAPQVPALLELEVTGICQIRFFWISGRVLALMIRS
jgi:hypothetical protein